jgi:EAL domain-containing protein (putative c-di-GMP-specific phosphodiesterase class I)
VSVNLSSIQIARPDLVDDVAVALIESSLPADALELEITETVAMEATEVTVRALASLRNLGVRIVLDDFGTGYSSLSYLKNLPLDAIKIDRSFVSELAPGSANVPIISAVVSLAHGLAMDVVAEGVETEAQAAQVAALGCDRAQGFLYARPLSAEEAAAYLESADAAAAAYPEAADAEAAGPDSEAREAR